MDELPRVSYGAKWYDRDWILDLVFTFGGVIGSGLSAWKLYHDQQNVPAVIGLFTSLMVFAAGAWKVYRSKKREDRYSPVNEPKQLAAWTQGLHAQIVSKIGRTDLPEDYLRIVIHRVEYERDKHTPKHLEQITYYVGGRGGPPGRKISARSGVIGQAVRLADPVKLVRNDGTTEEFIEFLVREYGFFHEEASGISATRWSFAAFPITTIVDGPVIGTVFIDSSDRNFFTDEIMEIVYSSTVGLTTMIRNL